VNSGHFEDCRRSGTNKNGGDREGATEEGVGLIKRKMDALVNVSDLISS